MGGASGTDASIKHNDEGTIELSDLLIKIEGLVVENREMKAYVEKEIEEANGKHEQLVAEKGL